jgi:hypothetical protein
MFALFPVIQTALRFHEPIICDKNNFCQDVIHPSFFILAAQQNQFRFIISLIYLHHNELLQNNNYRHFIFIIMNYFRTTIIDILSSS